jgi:hypothetical protein
MTKAQLRTLQAVHNGLVTQRFDQRGNVFECPPNISARLCRQLEAAGYMEAIKGRDVRSVLVARYKQQLTKKGIAALAGQEPKT